MAIKGWNFRAGTDGTAATEAVTPWVTDGTNETFDLGEAYPTTRNGMTFGWLHSNAGNMKNRNAAIDRRLAGCAENFDQGNQWQVDLTAAGAYSINAAFGDQGFNETNNGGIFLDNTTTLTTIGPTNTAADNWLDATGVNQTEAAWPGSNTAYNATFATTTFILKGPAASSDQFVSHILLTQAAAGPFPPWPPFLNVTVRL